MSVFAIVQAVILALVVGASVWMAWRKLMPATSKRCLAHLSASLERPERSVFAHRLARWVQPSEAKSGGCGSGDGCSACGGCAPAAAPKVEPVPLHFRKRP